MFSIWRLPLMLVDGPMEKVVGPLIVTLPLTVPPEILTLPPVAVILPPTAAVDSMRLPPVCVMFPDAPPPTKIHVCPLITVKLPLNLPLYAPLQAVPEAGTDPVKEIVRVPFTKLNV